jgi:hypothetical protein
MSGLPDQLHPADLPSVLNEAGFVPWSGILRVLLLVAVGIVMTTVMQSSTAAIAVTLSALYCPTSAPVRQIRRIEEGERLVLLARIVLLGR